MEDRQRTDKLLIVADDDGRILAASWPGAHSEGAPTETGMRIADEHTVHEVDVPVELYELARPDLSGYRIQDGADGAMLIRGAGDG